MADNVGITEGAGTAVATDDIGGAHYQWTKLAWGADGTANALTAALPLPASPGLKTTEQLTRAIISFASSGDNDLIAAVASQYVRIYAIIFTVASPVAVKLGQDGSVYYTGAMTFGAGGGLALLQQGEPHFISSAVNKKFLINLSAAVQCSGVVWYTQAA